MTVGLVLAGILAAAAGMALAPLAGPMTLGWPGRGRELVWRVAALSGRAPDRIARLAGFGFVSLVLAGGAVGAYATAPAAPAQARVARTSPAPKVMPARSETEELAAAIGAVKSSPAYLTLTRPTPAALGATHAARRRGPLTLVDMTWDSYEGRMRARWAYYREYRAAGGATDANGRISGGDLRRYLGDRYPAFQDNERRLAELAAARRRYDALVRGDLNTVLAIDKLPVDGPMRFEVAPGMTIGEAAKAAGLVSAIGYGMERRPPGQRMVMVKCYTSEAANARCA